MRSLSPQHLGSVAGGYTSVCGAIVGGTCDVTRVWKLLVLLLLAEAVRAA